MADDATPLAFTVHTMPSPATDDVARRTSSGRLKMLLLFLVCAAPVVASYVAYFVIRPDGRTNYSELIIPTRPIPSSLPLTDLANHALRPGALKGQWLLVVVSGGACDAACERLLWIQRQLREALATWLAVPPGNRLESHMAIVDPMGDWMMRVPADPDPARLKRDIERLLRAASGWDRPGR